MLLSALALVICDLHQDRDIVLSDAQSPRDPGRRYRGRDAQQAKNIVENSPYVHLSSVIFIRVC